MKELTLTKLFQGKIRKLGIQEIIPAERQEENKVSKLNIRIINRLTSSISKTNNPTVAILTKSFLNRLCSAPEAYSNQIDIILKNHIYLILANSSSIPAFFKDFIQNKNVTLAASKYDEYYLKSLLKALIYEKIQEIICVHGVLLEINGKGILISGASGIGKTTAALKIIANNDYWIADDFVIITKNKRGELIAGGHKKIQNYIHTKETGIVPVEKILGPDRIKKNTKLSALIEVERNDMKNSGIIKKEKKILDIKLICFHINMQSFNYIDEHLLKKALKQLSKEN